MMKKLTRKDLVKEVERIDPSLKGEHEDPTFITMLILLASAVVGPNIKRISKHLNIPRYEVRERAINCRKNKIWRGGKISAEWSGKHGGVAFMLDACVAGDLMNRVDEDKCG